MKIKEVMSKNVLVMNKNSDISSICDNMKKYDTGFIPICDDNKIIGVITDRDIAIRKAFLSDKIESFISNNIVTINQNSNLYDALNIMENNKIKRLIVTDNNKIVGIVSFSDLIKHIDSQKLINNLKIIYEIDKNNHDLFLSVDDFYL